MRKLLLLLLLFRSFAAGAQVINIPDTNLKYLLVHHTNPVVDANNDGEISSLEAWRTTQLNIFGTQYTNRPVYNLTGLEQFVNIQALGLEWMGDSARLFNFSLLNTARVYGSNMLYINFQGCNKLETLTCGGALTTLDVSNLPKLRGLSCPASFLDSINLGSADSLRSVVLSNNMFTHINLHHLPNLTSLTIENCFYLTDVRVRNMPKLTTFSISGSSAVRNLDNYNCPKLTLVNHGPLYNLETIDLTGCSALTNILLLTTKLQSLDLSSNPNVINLNINSQFLRHLNLKNGGSLLYWDIQCRDSVNVCVDDFEADTLTSWFAARHAFTNISPYCSIYSGGNYNTISGFIRSDINQNGCDTLDRGVRQIPVRFTDNNNVSTIRYTAPNGEFVNYVYQGNYTVRPYFAYPYYSLAPASRSVSFDTANNLQSMTNFCLNPSGSYNDLEIAFLPAWPPARPGMKASYQLIYKNRGTTILTGAATVQYDAAHMTYDSATVVVNVQSPGQLTWNFNNLQPFEQRTVLVHFTLAAPPVNTIGDTIEFLAAITPAVNDYTPDDNSFVLPQRIQGSFDPNEKRCFEGDAIDISQIGNYLHYQINFQNEGTDTAFNIVVADQLPANLDWETFDFTGSSHPCSVKRTNGKLEFIFPNILLPHKAINEPGSHGFVTFRIRPKSSVVVGDTLINEAAIYFDFNAPVITNEARTAVVSNSSPVPVKLDYFSVQSATNQQQLHWKVTCLSGSVRFVIERSADGIQFQEIGVTEATILRCRLPFQFTDAAPLSGRSFYRIKIVDADARYFYSTVISTGKRNTTFDLSRMLVLPQELKLSLQNDHLQILHWSVLGLDGRIVASGQQEMPAGSVQLNIPTPLHATGVYVLRLQTEQDVMLKRFLH